MRLTIAAVCLVGLPASASADWQNTKWGMTLQDLRSGPNQISEPDGFEENRYNLPGVGIAKAKSEMIIKDIGINAYFLFGNENKLSGIMLSTKRPDDTIKVLEILRNKYEHSSPPISKKTALGSVYMKEEWRSVEDNNRITFIYESPIDFGPRDLPAAFAKIIYQPIQSKDQSGF